MHRWAAVLLIATACAGSVPAPPIEPTSQVCADSFCVTVPAGWQHEAGEEAISFSHPDATSAIAFVSLVDMSWMLESVGATWPSSLESVERAYWSLLSDPPLTPDRLTVSEEGWASSQGRFEGLPRWHAVHALGDGPVALAITVEAPGDQWEAHARTFLEGVTLLP
ncbi:MAG: hypothetical protein ACE5MI_04790 [Acidimicrobiia bacterium]